MKKLKGLGNALLLGAVVFAAAGIVTDSAAAADYRVLPNDTMWKIASQHQVDLNELIQANPQVSNPASIHWGQVLTIPQAGPIQQFEEEVIALTNLERVKAGLPALKVNQELGRVARVKSQEMIDLRYFDHQSPTYGSPFEMMESFGISYTYAGENIAAGQQTAEEVVNGWMNSPGHRANIMNANYTQIGVGLAKGGSYGFYWTQQFIR
ncbi:hypothetical protein BEP19_03025 [Ammoniphilus oxalaticus]|uniref:LysM domain-containing protein n=1 Tax=Ammoniphilus oxalaticus TaxID=66863 RepID=A0A419SNS3_9BACL|nr:CAP domain-containing protein [Ammoniphilus oxalaticus]RKD25917.1 hypothetical protein BEP19_03025 [Ammoniphilus oxalaticus]